MFYLIDGYNLLFALGVLRDRTGPEKLEKARLRLLGFLHSAHGDEAAVYGPPVGEDLRLEREPGIRIG